ncbi:hypothetical protein ABPG72_015810 [Tetrahymena utriculariae]
MPNLLLPICMKTQLTNYHRVTHYLSIPEEKRLVTGGLNGDIIIWRIHSHEGLADEYSNNSASSPLVKEHPSYLEPMRYLTPCLSQTVGQVTCLQLIKNPINHEIDNSHYCILSIHQDNRVRIWDLRDGRCINISSHATFKSSNISICVPITPNSNRFFAVAGNGKGVEILDVWKLKSVACFSIDEKSTMVRDIQVVYEKSEMYVVDDQNILYCLKISEYQQNEYSVYSKYVRYQTEYEKQIKNAKCKLINKVKITSSKQQLVKMLIIQNIPFMLFIYPKKVLFQKADELYRLVHEHPSEEKKLEQQPLSFQISNQNNLKIHFQKSDDIIFGASRKKATPTYQRLKQKISLKIDLPKQVQDNAELEKTYIYNGAEYIFHNDQQYLLLFLQDGTCQLIGLKDIEMLSEFNVVSIDKDYSFDYASFSYSKNENSLKGKLSMQLVEILKGIQIDQDYKDNQLKFEVIGFERIHSLLFQFEQQKSQMTTYSFLKHFDIIKNSIYQLKYINFVSEPLQEEDDQKNMICQSDVRIVFNENSLQDSIYKKIDFSQFLFSPPEQKQIVSLFNSENHLVDKNRIFNQFFYLKYGQYLEEKYGDERITISSMDFLDDKNPFYFFGTESGKVVGIPLLYSDDKEMFDMLHYNFDYKSPITFLEYKKGYLIISSASGRSAVLQLQSSEEQIIKPDINFKGKLNIIDLSALPKFCEVFSSPIKHIMKPKIVNSILKDPANQEAIKDSQKYLKNTLCFILTNNSVIIYNTKLKQIDFKLNSNKSSIYGLYFNPISDYFIILTSQGQVNFWSMGSQRYEKTGIFINYSSLFDVEGLIQDNFQTQRGLNKYSTYKKIYEESISKVHSVLEFNQRHYNDTINFNDESSNKSRTTLLIYEQLGELRDQKHSPEEQLSLLWMIQQLKGMIYQSRNSKNGMSILKLKLNRLKQQTYSNQAFILFVDVKKHNQQIVDIFETAHDPEAHQIFSYIPFVYPWGNKADLNMAKYINHKKPVFNYIIGSPGMGQCFSFSLEKDSQYSTSSYLSSIQALSIILHLMILGVFKNSDETYKSMLEVANLFTKNKKRVDPYFKSLSLQILSRYCIDDSNEVMSSSSNLMINSLVYKEEDSLQYTKLCSELFNYNLQYLKEKDEIQFSVSEITWLLMITYTNIFSKNQVGDMTESIKRIVKGVELTNCLKNPNLVAPCMKILTEGINLWKDFIENYRDLVSNLIFIYFHYNTSSEYLRSLKDIPRTQLKKAIYLDQFLKQPQNIRKRMKLMTIKTIISLVNVCQNEFLQIVSREIENKDRHPLYPCSIIDIIRNYIKVQSESARNKLPIFIEIILKSLDPNNPEYRRICHQPATNALQAIFKIYPSISFHQNSQKFAVGTSQNQIFIYDLRTAVKWRVLAGHVGEVKSVSFDNSGKHIASFSSEDFILRIWKVGSTGFFSSILNMNGTPSKNIQIPRQEYEALVKKGSRVNISWDQTDRKLTINFGNESYPINLS